MKSQLQDLLVYGVNWIGDAVISLGTLQGIRKVSPSTLITVLSSSSTADIYRMSPVVERVVERSGSFNRPELGKRFPLALCFPLSFRSAIDLWLTGIPERIGFTHEFRSLLLTRSLDYREWKMRAQHQSTYYRAISEAAFGPLPVERPELFVSDELLRRTDNYLERNGLQKEPAHWDQPGSPLRIRQNVAGSLLYRCDQPDFMHVSGCRDRHVCGQKRQGRPRTDPGKDQNKPALVDRW